MMPVTVDRDTLKQTVKEAVLELMSERPEALVAALVEVIEDIGLAEAIRQGRETEEVTREELDAVLRGDA
jgi:hypothetical protein